MEMRFNWNQFSSWRVRKVKLWEVDFKRPRREKKKLKYTINSNPNIWSLKDTFQRFFFFPDTIIVMQFWSRHYNNNHDVIYCFNVVRITRPNWFGLVMLTWLCWFLIRCILVDVDFSLAFHHLFVFVPIVPLSTLSVICCAFRLLEMKQIKKITEAWEG